MKILKAFGILVVFFGLLTLINLAQTIMRIEQVKDMLGSKYASLIQPDLISLLTQFGIGFSQIILGILVYSSTIEESVEKSTQKSVGKNTKPLSEKSKNIIIGISGLAFIIAFLWQLFYSLNTIHPLIQPDILMFLLMPLIRVMIIASVLGITAYALAKYT
jgi:hypothetical protein